LTETSFCGA